MQIHNNKLIVECSAYDFKEVLERKKIKSWLKSVSAFANTEGGSLFYGVNDDGEIVGLENPQVDADFISETIKARLDPVPEIQLIPREHEGHTLLEVKVKAGTLTPYYYYQDGTRTAYVRVGNESVECNSQQLLSLVLKGTHMTWDSLPTQVDASKHSFIILANTFREHTNQEWSDKYLKSFGLVTSDGKLTNAGLLFVDNCTVFQSRIFCTRWTGIYKDNAISSIEHRANLVLLLKYGMDFIKNYTMSGWVKMPNYRLNLPDYSDRALFEGLVNHLIHRDYTIMGGEVHIDIYDDRVELVSPGAMLDGTQIQDRDISFSMIILRSCPHKDVGTALYILLTANWSRYNIFFLFIVYLCLCKRNFSIFNLVYSSFSMVTILCEFVNPYQSPCAITIRLQSEMTTNLKRFIITYFSVPLTVKSIVIKSWFCDILIFLFLLNLFSNSG